jgi:hypothetical protein
MRLCLRRREFVTGLGGGATFAFAARAQLSGTSVIGYLDFCFIRSANKRAVTSDPPPPRRTAQ